MRKDQCNICGTEDLYTAVAMEGICSICKIKYIGGLGTTPQLIARTRAKLGLSDGEFLQQDNAQEAKRILGR